MRKILLILSLLILGLSPIMAGDRTEQQMKEAAAKVLSSNLRRSASNLELKELRSLSKLKIYGYDEGGFAVVTKDDRFEDVIGYSYSKCTEEIPCGFKWWLEAANEAMENAKDQEPAKATHRSAIRRTGVSALLTTRWGQSKPYNNKCKITVNGWQYSMVTGCVATAMAQVMNYYKYPTKGKGENSYTIKYSDIGDYTYHANFENSYYDWNNMLDDYSDYYFFKPEDEYTDAVSQLMSDCGKAVNMIYRGSSSSAYSRDVPIALKNYFSYSFLDENKTIYYRDDFSNDDWMNVIYTALNSKHPILYCGSLGLSGHMFVIHGYDSDGKVYVNWGWNGSYDGYFMIDMLTPASYNFNNNQQMIIPVPEGTIVETKYKLSYFVDGILYKEYSLKSGDAITPEPAPTKEGYMFSGWSSIPQTMPANDVTIIGTFTKGAYKLTYVLDGVVYKTVSYDYGASIIPESAPTKKGHTFSGWNGLPSTMPGGDVTVTGSFTINKYKLLYQVDGEDYKTYAVEYGAAITPEPEPTKDGYVFSGWSYIPSTMPDHDVTISGEFTNGTESVNTVTARINGIYYILIGKSGTAEVTSSPNKYSGTVTIPETVEYEGFTYQVTQIGEKAFYFCTNLSSVSIPNSVMVIGNNAFSYCSSLPSIVLPSSIQAIGVYAFSYCNKLSSITIPDGVTIIRQGTFSGCRGLKSVWIPETVTSLESDVFYQCSSLESISLLTNLTSIGNYAFYKCESLTSIVVPDKMNVIGDHTFYGCTNLKTVKVGKSISKIYSKAFAECKSLENIVCMTENPPTVNSDAFENSYIEHVPLYVPDASINSYKSVSPWNQFGTIKGISEYNPEEQHAPSITTGINGIYYNLIGKSGTAEVTSSPNKYSGTVTIPETVEYEGFTYQVTQIGEKAFYSCTNLSSVSIPNSVMVIGNDAFSYCSSLPSIVLPSSIQAIGVYAFSYCNKLSSITIPDGVTIIRQGTFKGCKGLKSVKISDSVTSIEAEVFYGCSALESILLPLNLTSIKGFQCFYKCESLSSIVIPDKVSVIGDQFFYGCTNLKTVRIGESISEIYSKAFAECKSLENIICLAENTPSANSDAFENSYIENITLYVPEGSVNQYKSQEPWSKFGQINGFSGTIKFTLTYKVDGEVYKTYEIVVGTTITIEPDPTKEGYIFSGWSDVPQTMPMHDVTVIGTFERVFNVGDLANTVNYIMNANAGAADLALYDMNHDGELNIGDVILIVKWILDNANNGGKSARRRAGEIIDLRQYTAAQFIVKTPSMVKVKDIHLVNSMKLSHRIMYKQLDEQTYAVVVYSLSNQLIVPNNNNIIEIDSEGIGIENLKIQNATFAKPNGVIANHEELFVTTDIERSALNCNSPAMFFDLKGYRLDNGNSLKKVIYIINGKKVVVK